MDVQELGISKENTETISPSRDKEEDALERFRLKEIARKAREAAYAKAWRAKNAERYAKNRKEWAEKNREKLRLKSTEYYANNREKRIAQQKQSITKHSEAIKIRRKADRLARKDILNARWNAYYAAHPEKLKEKNAKYLPRRLELRKIRRASNPVEKLKDACRTRTRWALSLAGVQKHDHTFDLIGCTPNELKAHLESKFNRMMNWDNYGTYWEIDHIVAVSKFNLEKEEELFKAFHYTNCQPLEVPLNRSKWTRENWTPPAHLIPPA